MQGIRCMLLVAALVAVSAGASAQAAPHAKVSHTAHALSVATCPVGNPSQCAGACPRAAASAATVAQAKACAATDPSKCPASCRNTAAGATAVNVKH